MGYGAVGHESSNDVISFEGEVVGGEGGGEHSPSATPLDVPAALRKISTEPENYLP